MVTYNQVDPKKIEKSIESFVCHLPSDLISDLKEYFEKNIANIIDESYKLEIKLILDTNSVISNLIHFAKMGDSILHKIIKEPIIELYAPINLIEETERNIPIVARKKNLNRETMVNTWKKDLLPKIIIEENIDDEAYLIGKNLMSHRDNTDIPFVALYFQLSTHGILTRDLDITSQSEIKTWDLNETSRITTILKKGAFSFYIQSSVLPAVLKMFFNIIVTIIKTSLETILKITKFTSQIIKGIINKSSQLPVWFQLLIGLSLIVLILKEETRNAAINLLEEIRKTLVLSLSNFYDIQKKLLEILYPLLEVSVLTLSTLFKSYEDAIEQLRILELQKGIL